MRIGTFRSLTNPKKRYAIFRKTGKFGGIVWICACASDRYNDAPCKHLRCLWAYAKHKELPSLLDSGFITLTKIGRRYFERQS